MMPLYAPEADPAALSPISSALVVLRGGEPMWGGIVWTLSADLSAQTLTVNASGWHSYYKGRAFTTGYDGRGPDGRGMDQADHLRAWFTSAADNGIATDASYITSTGRRRVRMWTRSEFKVLAEAISELAEDEGGFNFRYQTYWVERGKRIGNRFLKYENRDQDEPFSLVHGVNCNVTQVDYDGSQLATDVHTIGADPGNGDNLVGFAANEELRKTMLTKRVVSSFSDVKETETLMAKATALIRIGRAPIAIPSLTLYPGLYDPTAFIPGHSGVVEADSGYVALYADFVVTERKIDVNSNGTEITTLSLANMGVPNGG
ncbi:hypothetical protein ACFU7T_18995 [Streptomyces sp. NPDC057555]|uniref:hypothetical protein n=1 Tax=Streptomyces sp. NPDC057555 TaxID=3346166 RepID=UPI0036825CD2